MLEDLGTTSVCGHEMDSNTNEDIMTRNNFFYTISDLQFTMGRYSGKTCRLICMIGLTGSFFVVELVVGYLTNSLALVGDAYHMLSDVIALIIGVASVRVSH